MRRREFLIAITSTIVSGRARAAKGGWSQALGDLEHQIGGRIGVGAMNVANGAHLEHRGDERFAMCSTFKWLLAAVVLEHVDQGAVKLHEKLTYSAKDLLSNSPVTQDHVADGSLSVEALCAAVVEVSDNTAANRLLALIGGPDGLTRKLRQWGDRVTRLDRMELALNSNLPDDEKDTTSPNAMVMTMKRILLDDTLSPESRDRLINWMKNCQTGKARLRAGVPSTWIAGDKTGTGENGAANDVAIFWPPKQEPILIAAYFSGSTRSVDELNAARARIGKMVADAIGPGL